MYLTAKEANVIASADIDLQDIMIRIKQAAEKKLFSTLIGPVKNASTLDALKDAGYKIQTFVDTEPYHRISWYSPCHRISGFG